MKNITKNLIEQLKNDKELYYAYQSNIAIQFVDEAKRQGSRDSHKKLHSIANQAAKNFLDLWIKY